MTTAVARKPGRQIFQLREHGPLGKLSVDREAGVIRRVKVCGLRSDNGREYTPDALRKAIPLYEGAKVYADHELHAKPGQVRSVNDLFGVIRNVRQGEDGLYGDLYTASHPLTESVFDDAERNLGMFCLSHNATGKGEHRNGVLIVTEIVDVKSVDLVSEGATVKSLRESKMKSRTIRDVVDSMRGDAKTKLVKLIEADDDLGMDTELGEPAVVGGGDWKADLLAALAKLLDSEDAEDAKKVDALMKLLKNKPAAVTEADEEDKGKDEEEKEKMAESKTESRQRADDDPTIEDLHEALVRQREELAVRDLVEDAGLAFAKPEHRRAFIKSLIPLQESDRRSLISERKEMKPAEVAEKTKQKNSGARSIAAGSILTEARRERLSGKDFAQLLRG